MSRKCICVFAILVACIVPTHAKIKVFLATQSDFVAANCIGAHLPPLYCPSNPGAAWLRSQGYRSLSSAAVQGAVGYVNQIAEGSSPFLGAINGTLVEGEYVAYGAADVLILPKNGEYQFKVFADVSAFIFIDTTVLAHPDTLKDMNNNYQGTILGTATGTKGSYIVTIPNLTAGNHKLEFLYFNSGAGSPKFRLLWKTPGDTSLVPVPALAFGDPVSARQVYRNGLNAFARNMSYQVNRVTTLEALKQPVQVTVTDFAGKTVYVTKPTTASLDLKSSGLGYGLYLAQIRTSDKSRLERVMITR